MSADALPDWLHDPEPGPARDAIRSAAAEVRRLAIALLRADTDAMGDDDLEPVILALRSAAGALADLPSIPEDLTPAGPKHAPTFLAERSPISGAANVASAPLHLSNHPGRTQGVATYSEVHEGPSRHVHGGVIAAAFDELLGVAQVHSGAAGYTASLTVRFHRKMPLFEPIVYEATVNDRDERRIHVQGHACRQADPGTVLASATGTFAVQAHLPVPEHVQAPRWTG